MAALYKGKTVVIIGGDRRPYAYEASKSAFRLKDLIWIATREHESTEDLSARQFPVWMSMLFLGDSVRRAILSET